MLPHFPDDPLGVGFARAEHAPLGMTSPSLRLLATGRSATAAASYSSGGGSWRRAASRA